MDVLRVALDFTCDAHLQLDPSGTAAFICVCVRPSLCQMHVYATQLWHGSRCQSVARVKACGTPPKQ